VTCDQGAQGAVRHGIGGPAVRASVSRRSIDHGCFVRPAQLWCAMPPPGTDTGPAMDFDMNRGLLLREPRQTWRHAGRHKNEA
jgi:hypothetical protein